MTEVIDKKRRRLLVTVATVVGGVGAIATLVPFIETWEPSARAKSAGAPVTVDFRQTKSPGPVY